MNNLKISVLSAAVIASFAGVANAAVTLGTPAKFASEIITPVKLSTPAAFDVTLAGLSGVNNLVSQVTYRVDLTGGIQFATTPTLTCSARMFTAGVSSTATALTASLAAGGNGQTYALFSFATGHAYTAATAVQGVDVSAGDALYLNGCVLSTTAISADDTATKSVSATVTYTVNSQVFTDTTSRAGTWISFAKAFSASISAPATTAVIDGTTSSAKFVTLKNVGVTTANMGTVVIVPTNTAAIYGVSGVTLVTADLTAVASSAVITASGATLGGATVTANVFVDTGACAASQYANANTTGSTITIGGINAGLSTTGMNVCIVVPGTGTISESQVTLALTAGSTANYTPSLSLSGNAANVVTNGEIRNGYNIHSKNSTGKTTMMRIINKSGLTGDLKGTLYNAAGTDIGGGQKTVGTFTADNQTLTFDTSTALEAVFGTNTAATDKSYIKFYFSKGNYEVLNYTKDLASGAITLTDTSKTDTK